MTKKYIILKRFSYQDKDGKVVVVERYERDPETGGYKTDAAARKFPVIRELSKEALDQAKIIKKASGKPAIEEYDE